MAGDTLTLLTWNIWNHHEGEAAFGNRARGITEAIVDLAPDIVCLQEVPSRSFARALSGQLSRHQRRIMRVATTEAIREDGWREHLAIIHPGTGQAAVSLTTESPERFAIAVAVARPAITVVSTHFDFADSLVRRAQATRLTGALRLDGPSVICGDFNAISSGETCRILGERLTHLAPEEGQVTFPTPIRSDIAEPSPAALDHIFGAHLEVEECGPVGDEPRDGIWLSDHVGVWARLKTV